MEVEYRNDDLERLENDPEFSGGFATDAVRGFRKVIQLLRAAVDERDLWAMRSLNFEKLKGVRQHERSIRLNKQWRLILEVVPAEPKNRLALKGIEDYH